MELGRCQYDSESTREACFRQACMNLTELIGIAGCPHESGRRRAEENQSDIGESQSEGRNSAALRVLAQYSQALLTHS